MAAKKKEAKKPVSKSRKPRKPHTEQHAGKAEMLYRITEVFRYMLQAKPRGAICQIMANKYDMSERQTSEYIRRARIMLAEKLDEEIELSLQYHLKARQNILDQSVDMGDNRVALAALQDLAQLQGMYKNKSGAAAQVVKVEEVFDE